MQMHIKSRYEYTRIEVKSPVQLTKGDYELTVSAKASKSETFFLWVYDSDSSTRIGGTLHIGEEQEKLSLGFSLFHTTNIEIGVLAHKHSIGDFCEIDFVAIQQQKMFDRIVKPISLEPNQSAKLSNQPDYWEIIANQDRSTPGCRYLVDVTQESFMQLRLMLKLQVLAHLRFCGHTPEV